MTQYRPITDMWILARPKSHYYGAYPEGFLWRAKALLNAGGKCLHMCSGKLEPYFNIDKACIKDDDTLDINPKLRPTFIMDATRTGLRDNTYDNILIDPPYTDEDAKRYGTSLPNVKDLINEATRICKPGGRIGMLHYIIPRPPASLRLIAIVSVFCGFNNRIRALTIFERVE